MTTSRASWNSRPPAGRRRRQHAGSASREARAVSLVHGRQRACGAKREVPGLRVQLFVHVGRGDRDTRHESEILREFATKLSAKWSGPLRPMLYYDPRSLDLNSDKRATWHTKVVVMDDERAFVTSANFTEWAQQRNVEAGVLIRNADFARQLRQQFE